MRACFVLMALALCAAGCRTQSLGFGGPGDYISSQQASNLEARTDLDLQPDVLINAVNSPAARNNYITAKMFVIDRNYALYEPALTRNTDAAKFLGSLATIGMSTAGAVIPIGPTTKILHATVTAVQGAEAAVDTDLLQSQAIQSITRQMRADRANQAKVLFDRMRQCSLSHYPVYLALTDLEAYRQAGTFESALASLGRTTALVETVAVNNKNSTAPASIAGAASAAAANAVALNALVPQPKASICPL